MESGIGTWAGLEVGVGLNSRGKWLWLTESKLLVWLMKRPAHLTMLPLAYILARIT